MNRSDSSIQSDLIWGQIIQHLQQSSVCKSDASRLLNLFDAWLNRAIGPGRLALPIHIYTRRTLKKLNECPYTVHDISARNPQSIVSCAHQNLMLVPSKVKTHIKSKQKQSTLVKSYQFLFF